MKRVSFEHVFKTEPQPSTSAGLVNNPVPVFQLTLNADDCKSFPLKPNAKNLKVPSILPAIVEVPEIPVSEPNINFDLVQHPVPEFQRLHSEAHYYTAEQFLTNLTIVLTVVLILMAVVLLLLILEHNW